MVATLLAASAAVDALNGRGNTPLHVAARKGLTEVVAALLEASAAVDTSDVNDNTPLHFAAWKGHTEVVTALLAAGATVDATNEIGNTPLHYAALNCHTEAVATLLAASAAVDAISGSGYTPLHVAAISGRTGVVAALLGASATVNATNGSGITPLHVAARNGHTEVVAALLAASAAADATSGSGITPLHYAAWNGRAEVVAALLAAKATVDALNGIGYTPLHDAALNGHTEVVAALLAADAAVDASRGDGYTPLHVAAGKGHTDVVVALLAAGAAVDATDGDGRTALLRVLFAVENRIISLSLVEGVIKVLCGWGARVPARYSSRFSQVGSRRHLGRLLDGSHPWSEQEREAAKAKWRASAAQLTLQAATPPSAADRALSALKEVYAGFVADPETLTLGNLDQAVPAGRVVDVRGLRCAHQILVFADRLGLFAQSSAEETEARQLSVYEHVYLPILGSLEPVDRHCVDLLVRRAAEHNLLAAHHVSEMITALYLHATFHCELRQVNLRLNNLETAVDHLGQHLSDTIQGLCGLQRRIQDKEEREQKVALVKSAVKLGVSLAPFIGGVLNVSADVVAALAEGASGATAMYQLLADPADATAALKVIRCVQDEEESFTTEMQERLAKMLIPYQSLEAVVEDLESAAKELGTDIGPTANDVAASSAGVAESVVVVPREEAADEVAAAQAEAAEDHWSKPQEVLLDALGEHTVDWAADQRRGAAARPVPSAALTLSPSTTGNASPCPTVSLDRQAVATGPAAVGAPRPTRRSERPRPRAHECGVAGPAAPTAVVALTPSPPRAGYADSPAENSVPEVVQAAIFPTVATGSCTPRCFGAPFFAGVADWRIDAVVAKLVAYVAGNYPRDDRDAFAAAARDGAAHNFIDGAAVVRCEGADVAKVVADLLGTVWCARSGTVVSVRRFFVDAKAFAQEDGEGGGGGRGESPPLQRVPPRVK